MRWCSLSNHHLNYISYLESIKMHLLLVDVRCNTRYSSFIENYINGEINMHSCRLSFIMDFAHSDWAKKRHLGVISRD